MSSNTKNVLAGIAAGGAGTSLCYVAPVGATAPTSATSALSSTNTNEVQTVTITGTPTGGTFTLSFLGAVTTGIAYNATASAVQTALAALATIGSGNVAVTGSAGGPYTVTFQGALAATDVAMLVANAASLTGGTSPNVTVAETTKGVGGWVDAGWCSDKGLTVKLNEAVNDVMGFGSVTPVRKIITKSEQNFDIEFLESNLTTLAIYNRKAIESLSTPSGSGGEIDFATGGSGMPHFAAVFDMVDGSNHIRAYCPDVAVTSRSDLVIGAGQAVAYPVSLTAFPDSTGNSINWFYLVSALAV